VNLQRQFLLCKLKDEQIFIPDKKTAKKLLTGCHCWQ